MFSAFRCILWGLLFCAGGTHGTTCGPGLFYGTAAVQSSLMCTSQASSGPVCEVTFTALGAAPLITIEVANSDFYYGHEYVSKVTVGGQALGGRYLQNGGSSGNCDVMTKIVDAATVPAGAVSAAGALVVRIETSSSVGAEVCSGHGDATLVAKVSITYDELGCVQCAPGQYKLATGSGACTECSAGSNSPQGATSCHSTTCGPGLFYDVGLSSLLCMSQDYSGPTCEVTFVVLGAGAAPRITIEVANSDFADSSEYVSKVTVGGQALGGRYLDYADSNLDSNCAVMTKIVDTATVPAGAVSAVGELVVRIETSSSVGGSYSGCSSGATLVANVSITYEQGCVPCAPGQYKLAMGSGACTDCGAGSYSRELGSTACGSCGEAGEGTVRGQVVCSCKAGSTPVVTLPPVLCTSTTTKGPACNAVFSSVSLVLSPLITIEVVHSDFSSSDKYVSGVTVGDLALGGRYLEGQVGYWRSQQCDMMTKIVDAATVPTGAVSAAGELVVWIRTSPDVGLYQCDESSGFKGATLVVNVSLSYVAECAACTAGQYKEKMGSDPCMVCKAGTSSPPGAISDTQCGLCPSGKYARTAGSLICAACDAGKSTAKDVGRYSQPYSSAGATACQTCNIGEYSASEAAECTICSTGKYSSSPCPVTVNGRDCRWTNYYYNDDRKTCTCRDPNYLGSTGCTSCPWGSSSPAASFEATHCRMTGLAIFGIASIVLVVPAGIAILFYRFQREKAISIYRFFIPPRTASVQWRQEQVDFTGMLQGGGRVGGGEVESAPAAENSIGLPAGDRSACGSVYKYEHLDFTGVLSGGGGAGPRGGGRGGGGGIESACGSAYSYTQMQFPGAMEADSGGLGSEGGGGGLEGGAGTGAGVGEWGRLGGREGGAGGAGAAIYSYEGPQVVTFARELVPEGASVRCGQLAGRDQMSFMDADQIDAEVLQLVRGCHVSAMGIKILQEVGVVVSADFLHIDDSDLAHNGMNLLDRKKVNQIRQKLQGNIP